MPQCWLSSLRRILYRLLPNSLSFFKKMTSISFRLNSSFNRLFSLSSLSMSVRFSSFLQWPRLSFRPSVIFTHPWIDLRIAAAIFYGCFFIIAIMIDAVLNDLHAFFFRCFLSFCHIETISLCSIVIILLDLLNDDWFTGNIVFCCKDVLWNPILYNAL